MDKRFLSGVVEGFYGPPWTGAERFELFALMAAAGLNTYFYAPKDDRHHRVRWRELYGAREAASMSELIQGCQRHGLEFYYALGPGMDIRYSDPADLASLQARIDQLLQLGCRHFGLLFDDIPDALDPRDRQCWGTFAEAQSGVTNALARWLWDRQPEARLLFCPTAYCGRMAEAGLGGAGYLAMLGRALHPGIDVFWTGPEIISGEVSTDHVGAVAHVLGRKPILWDNLCANDYDGRRFFCGPYAGRALALRSQVGGILLNPNTEFCLNEVPIRTLGLYLAAEREWDPRAAYVQAMNTWFTRWTTGGEPLSWEDFLLFGDCFYLPYHDGREAVLFGAQIEAMLGAAPSAWGQDVVALRAKAARLRDFCARLPELNQRSLFYALSRRVWEMREELDLLVRYLDFASVGQNRPRPFTSDYHRPQTFRGGWLARLQQGLLLQADGSFRPNPHAVIAGADLTAPIHPASHE
jgi:protein O-GlcNAcase / histone acetyltransferase